MLAEYKNRKIMPQPTGISYFYRSFTYRLAGDTLDTAEFYNNLPNIPELPTFDTNPPPPTTPNL
jgi:hypothetical protein